ncbi:MAG: hypothetical protein AAGC45_14710 [Bacteroidota bacterium]
MPKSTFKKNILVLYNSIGRIAGLVVFVVANARCSRIFEEEMESIYEDFQAVSTPAQSILTANHAIAVVEETFPGPNI